MYAFWSSWYLGILRLQILEFSRMPFFFDQRWITGFHVRVGGAWIYFRTHAFTALLVFRNGVCLGSLESPKSGFYVQPARSLGRLNRWGFPWDGMGCAPKIALKVNGLENEISFGDSQFKGSASFRGCRCRIGKTWQKTSGEIFQVISALANDVKEVTNS